MEIHIMYSKSKYEYEEYKFYNQWIDRTEQKPMSSVFFFILTQENVLRGGAR